jgi:hypothetical protein
MKPAPIANYLDHMGRGSSDSPPRPSPFRPRSLGPQGSEPRAPTAYERAAKAARALSPEPMEKPRPLFERRAPAPVVDRESLAAREAAKAEEMARRVEEARAQGLKDGVAAAHAEVEERLSAERIALQQRAAAERLDFELNEYARLETVLNEGFAQIESQIGGAVARILSPFVMKEVAIKAVDELAKAIRRIAAGQSPGVITIRGPERVLSLLRDRVAGLAIEIEPAEGEVEATVECNATSIVTELQPWAELLGSLDA